MVNKCEKVLNFITDNKHVQQTQQRSYHSHFHWRTGNDKDQQYPELEKEALSQNFGLVHVKDTKKLKMLVKNKTTGP